MSARETSMEFESKLIREFEKESRSIKNNVPKLKKRTDEVLNKRFIISTFQKQD